MKLVQLARNSATMGFCNHDNGHSGTIISGSSFKQHEMYTYYLQGTARAMAYVSESFINNFAYTSREMLRSLQSQHRQFVSGAQTSELAGIDLL